MEAKKEVYVISLDALDINLLPTSYNHSHEKVVPLWTKSNLDLRNNDYYEFVIKTNEDSQQIDKKNIVIEFITCHICDMDVPKLYMNEHRESFKHKFNKKIADVALKRLQLYMSGHENTDSINNERNPSTYYCPECSMIVDRDDEISHKNSIPHRNSVIFERFLNDFLYLYTNDSKLDVTDSQDIKTDVETNNEIKDGATNDSSTTKEKQLGNRDIKNIPAVNKADKKKCNISLKDYLTVLNNKFDTKPMFFKAIGDLVEIEAIDGSVVRVCEESFHALKKLSKKFVQCMLCKYIFDLTSDEHILSDGHMKMVSLPLKDKHCVRQISESWSHCLICNTIIESTDLHELCNTEHNNNLKHLLISDRLNESDDKCNRNSDLNVKEKNIAPKLLYNDVLKGNTQNLTNVDDSIVPHVDTNVSTDTKSSNIPSNEIIGKRFCHDCNVSISIKKYKKHENTMKHILNTISDKHYLLRVLDANQLQCKICEVHVKNTFDYIEKHFSETNHVDSYNKLLNINNIKKRDKVTYYCSNCHVYILFKNEYLHIESTEHKLKSNVDVKPKSETIGKSDEPVANICNTVEPDANVCKIVEPLKNVTKIVEPVKNSTKNESGETSRTVEPDTDSKVKVEPKDKTDPNYHFCVTCEVKVPNNRNNIIMHNKGKPHMKKLEILESDIKKQEIINKKSDPIHYLLAETKTMGVLICKICSVELTKNDANIKTHLEGTNHTVKYETFLIENRLIVVADKIYCAVCFDLVGDQSEMSHCTSKKHILNLMA